MGRLRRRQRPGIPLSGVYPMLYLSSIWVAVLVFIRMEYTESLHFSFLLWNLFLAWIPAWLALFIYWAHGRQAARPMIVVLFAAWLAFFPNAPYIATDVVHINLMRAPLTRWYDIIAILSAAWTGCFLGFVSLFTVHRLIARIYGTVTGIGFAAAAILLGSLGIYIGRFLRWNSWDLVTRPLSIAEDLRGLFADPQAIGFTALFAGFLLTTYAVLYRLASRTGHVQE